MDEQKTNKIPYDPSKLSPEQRDQLDKWNQNKQIITNLEDMANILQDISSTLSNDDETDTDKKMGALLADMRDSLATLKDKEAPKSPDYAQPVVAAVSKLEKVLASAIKAVDVKPNVKIDAPQVNVQPPDVDLKGVEKILKTDIPKAFQESISRIPKPEKPDYAPLLSAWEGISEQLVSLENATRMKPLPGNMAINNLNEIQHDLIAGTDFDYLSATNSATDEDTLVYKLNDTTVQTLVITYAAGADKVSESISVLEWS